MSSLAELDGRASNAVRQRSGGLALARVTAEILGAERGTWFDMCPGRGANKIRGSDPRDPTLWSASLSLGQHQEQHPPPFARSGMLVSPRSADQDEAHLSALEGGRVRNRRDRALFSRATQRSSAIGSQNQLWL